MSGLPVFVFQRAGSFASFAIPTSGRREGGTYASVYAERKRPLHPASGLCF